MTAKIDNQNL